MDWNWACWLDKAAPNLVVALVTGVVAVSVGAVIALYWNLRQKSRELDLDAAKDFHAHYGEFFAIWKLWNWHLDNGSSECEGAQQWQLLSRACVAEGGMESILSKLAAHRRLSHQDVVDLACFRQAFQQLRECIREGEPLDWYASEIPEYVRFKALTGRVSRIIHSPSFVIRPADRDGVWPEITSNKWEPIWMDAEQCAAGNAAKRRA